MDQISIFKTSVNSIKKVHQIEEDLNKIIEIDRWNFDLEDCDNILRIESSSDGASKAVSEFLKENGYTCIELN